MILGALAASMAGLVGRATASVPSSGHTVQVAAVVELTQAASAFEPAVRLKPPVPTVPVGCLQYAATPDAAGVFVINPNQYQRVAATPETGPKGAIIVIGDSLTWQTTAETAAQLRTSGWGPVCVSGTISATVQFGNAEIPDGLDTIARIRASAAVWRDGDPKVVIALGTNDSGISASSLTAAKSYVSNMLGAIGPTAKPVSWMTVHTKRLAPWPTREGIFNRAIVESGVETMPWDAEFQNTWVSADKIHCTPTGKAARVALYARL